MTKATTRDIQKRNARARKLIRIAVLDIIGLGINHFAFMRFAWSTNGKQAWIHLIFCIALIAMYALQLFTLEGYKKKSRGHEMVTFVSLGSAFYTLVSMFASFLVWITVGM